MQYNCGICNKDYSSRNSLNNHKRRFHKASEIKVGINMITIMNEEIKLDEEYLCSYCDKSYKYKQSRSRHQKKCKKRDLDYDDLYREMYYMSQELEEYKKKVNHLENNGNRCRNRISHNNINNNNNNNSNNNINNGTVNNINIIGLGKEDLIDKLSIEKQLEILNKGRDSLCYLIKYIHFNPEYPEYQNIKINNMRGVIGYMFNEETRNFEAVPKSDLIEDVKFERIADIENFYEFNSDNIDTRIDGQVERLIKRIYNSESIGKRENLKIECAIYNGTQHLTEGEE